MERYQAEGAAEIHHPRADLRYNPQLRYTLEISSSDLDMPEVEESSNFFDMLTESFMLHFNEAIEHEPVIVEVDSDTAVEDVVRWKLKRYDGSRGVVRIYRNADVS